MPQWEYCSLQFIGDTLTYFLYLSKELEAYDIYQGEYDERVDDITARHVGMLGLHGWEAIQVHCTAGGAEHWYFKRRIHPHNQYLQFR